MIANNAMLHALHRTLMQKSIAERQKIVYFWVATCSSNSAPKFVNDLTRTTHNGVSDDRDEGNKCDCKCASTSETQSAMTGPTETLTAGLEPAISKGVRFAC